MADYIISTRYLILTTIIFVIYQLVMFNLYYYLYVVKRGCATAG